MSQLLQEYVDSRGVVVSVDREAGVLRGVKLIGLESQNGRRYLESALAAAVTLYEESKVNVNHPKEGPLAPRDYQDRLGVIRNVKLRRGEGLYGDLHFNPKHALAEQLLWDAQHNPRNVGFSHNVLARLSRDGETTVVEEITKVQSVDLVADPATTQGLFEQTTSEASDTSDEVQLEEASIFEALTLKTLQQHCPELLTEFQSEVNQRLQQQVNESQALVASLQKKLRIVELLCEHKLPVPKEQSSESGEAQPEVSSLFVEWLMNVSEERDLEALIAERAELVRSATQGQHSQRGHSSPRSRDQNSILAVQSDGGASPQGFAEALKSSRN